MFSIHRKFLAACALLSALLPVAHADLVPRTLQEGAFELPVTTDTLTGLDWLDVPLTVNQTYDDVRKGPYYAMGFRHATHAELQQLFVHAGTPDDWFDVSQTYPAETKRLAELLGITHSAGDNVHTMGFAGSDYFGNTITLETHPIGKTFSALLGKVDFMDLRSMGSLLIGEAHFTGGHPFSDQPAPEYGSFLVRQVGATSPCRAVGSSPNMKCDGQGRGQYK